MKLRIFIISMGLMAGIATASAQVKKWTLEECVNYALKENISIQQSRLDMESSTYDKKGALGNFLPTASATADHSWNIGLTQNITTGVLEDQTTQNTSVSATAVLNIFQGFSNLNQLHLANLNLLANQYQIDGMKDDISLLIANSFLQILFNIETLKVLESQYALTLEEIERTKVLISSGQLAKGEIYELEANAASQSQQIVVAKNNIRISKISLAQSLLITDYDNFDIATENYNIPSSVIMGISPNEIYQKALEIRNEVKLSETNVELAEKNYDLSKSGVYPTLVAFYNYNTRASNALVFSGLELNQESPTNEIGFVEGSGETVVEPNFSSLTSSANPIFDQFNTNKGHSFGFQLTVPIFSGLTNHVSMQQNRINIERSELNLENTKIELESNVYQAYNDATASSKAYDAAQKTLFAREKAFEYAQERYNVGVINSFEFIQTQQALEAAQSEVVRTKFDYIFKLKVLELYFGVPIAG